MNLEDMIKWTNQGIFQCRYQDQKFAHGGSADITAKFIEHLARQVWAKTVLEIGVAEGFTSLHLVSAMNAHGRVTGVDVKDWRVDAFKELEKHGAYKFVLGRSPEILSELPEPHYDFVFIDGDHNPGTVLQELTALGPCIDHRSILALHDVDEKTGLLPMFMDLVNGSRWHGVLLPPCMGLLRLKYEQSSITKTLAGRAAASTDSSNATASLGPGNGSGKVGAVNSFGFGVF